MPNKAVISIDVDDSAFKRFTEMFDAYTAKLDEQPEAYKKLEEAMAGATGTMREGAVSSKEAFATAAAQAGLISEAILHAGRAQNEFNRSTNTANRGLSGLAKTAHGLGQTIFGIATSVLKIGAEGLGLGALASIGSFFGLGGLAKVAFDRQKDASGLGISTGRLTAFKDDAQDLLGVGALQATVNAQRDIKSTGPFMKMGIDFNKAQNQDPIALAFDELQAAGRGWMAAKKAGLPPRQNYAVQGYVALGGDPNDVQRIASRQGMARIQRDRAEINRDAPGLETGNVDGLIEFKKQLDLAGDSIRNDLIKTMGPLAPVLTDLSKDLVGLAGEVIGNKDVQKAVKDAAQGLADFLTRTPWEEIGKNLSAFAAGVSKVAGFFGLYQDDQKAKVKSGQLKDTNAEITGAVQTAWDFITHDPLGKIQKTIYNNAPFEDKIALRALAGDYDPHRINAANQLVSKKYGLPKNLLDRLTADESGYGNQAHMISSAGALGPYQFMPGTAAQYGIDPLDTRQASNASGKMISDLAKHYGGDFQKAIAAYNMGQGGLDDVLNGYKDSSGRWHPGHSGKDWLKYVPEETRGEVQKVVGSRTGEMDSLIVKALQTHARAIAKSSATKSTVHVKVSTPPGQHAAISTNAAVF